MEILLFREEIKKVVWDCDFLKVFGVDGYNFGFIKKMWFIVGDDVMKCM